jgi:aspartokinase/homoserine dehydrogenase 1
MRVLKFGGTSVADAANIEKTISIIRRSADLRNGNTVVVVSALSGVTDQLLKLADLASKATDRWRIDLESLQKQHIRCIHELNRETTIIPTILEDYFTEIGSILEGIHLLKECSPRTLDRIASYGELLSSRIISQAITYRNIPHHWLDARAFIRTDSQYNNARVVWKETEKLLREGIQKSNSSIYLLPGFIASDHLGHTTTLGRGGSDYTASLIASALQAEALEIWTDVSGMMTADPRLCRNARVVDHISYQEAMELSHFGAKVIYPPTIQPVMQMQIPVWIKNTFKPEDAGTCITGTGSVEKRIVCGLSSMSKLSLILLEGSGMIGIPGFGARFFGALAKEKINVILITQSSSEHSICAAIAESDAERAKSIASAEFEMEMQTGLLQPLQIENDVSIVALVGDQMKSHPGISGRMFAELGRNGINIRAIAQGSSEKNISAVIHTRDVRKAINALHETFFDNEIKQLNLFIAGTGNVGSKLLEQINSQREFLIRKHKIHLNIAGLINSRKMHIDEDGVDARAFIEGSEGSTADVGVFISTLLEKNLRNSVFVDITSNEIIASCYGQLLRKSIAVVACNKIAAASPLVQFNELKELASSFNTHFLFETNVGAALPVISTLQDLRNSGDEIVRIEAVLSGTLNFVFNHYDGKRNFSDVVRQAQDEGYTEPDPRLDLSGIDVMRKALILARESGFSFEFDDIVSSPFMPEECMRGSVDQFYRELSRTEIHFRKLYEDAQSAGCRLKYVADISPLGIQTGLRQIQPNHDLYHLYGKDNVVLFYTRRYKEQPLVIKGAGAGADVTAAGIFADVLRSAR